MPRPSKTEPWPDHGDMSIQIKPETKVYTCEIDRFGHISMIPGMKKEGQKCIVILF